MCHVSCIYVICHHAMHAIQLKQLAEEKEKAEAARVLLEEQLSADIQSFVASLSSVTDAQVSTVFDAAAAAAAAPVLQLEEDK
jgi:hypothetical protein